MVEKPWYLEIFPRHKGSALLDAFGVGKPGASSVLSIASEINFPWAQIDRKTGGAFAEDALRECLCNSSG